MSKLTQRRLKELLRYDPQTGEFTWLVSRGRVAAGHKAGRLTNDGRWQIKVDGGEYFAHRLAWFYVHGYFPEHEIDHINRNPLDNRLSNLRHVSRSCNARNCKTRKDNPVGLRGVSTHSQTGLYYVQFKSQQIYYGPDFGEAVCHRLALEQALDWPDCDFSSPAYQWVKAHINSNVR